MKHSATKDWCQSLVGLHQDDENLIKAIKKKYLHFPEKGLLYNFTKNPDIKGQWGQAEALEKLFKGKKNGFFIEAGAYDGEHFANTLMFEMKHDWTGLLVEPNPDNYEKLKTKNRKAIITETCFSTEKEVVSVEFDAAGAVGGIINGNRKPGKEKSFQIQGGKKWTSSSDKFTPFYSFFQHFLNFWQKKLKLGFYSVTCE